MNHNPTFDASIPVLTEVFQDEPVSKEVADAPPVGPAAGIPAQAAVETTAEAPPAPGSAGPDWDLLERRLAERIMVQLQDSVDAGLEQRVRDSVAAVLEQALSGAVAEIRDSLQQSIEKIVVHAVAQELAHLRTPPK